MELCIRRKVKSDFPRSISRGARGLENAEHVIVSDGLAVEKQCTIT